MCEKFEPEAALRAWTEHGITRFYGVPTMVVALLAQARATTHVAPKGLKTCVSGGAPLPVEVANQFMALFHTKIVEVYGLTEISGGCSMNPWKGVIKTGTVGQAMVGNEMRLVDEEGNDVGVGERGEVLIRGKNLMTGYWNHPEATARAIRDGWLVTGDIATVDEDGYYTIVDRKKDLIIVGGENVYPREVEEVLYQFPGVLEVAVIGVAHDKMGEVPKAFVVLRPGTAATEADLVGFVSVHLAKFKVPRAIDFREALPKNATGKIMRRQLREP